jgi:hypothetical protein
MERIRKQKPTRTGFINFGRARLVTAEMLLGLDALPVATNGGRATQ